jgi:NTE family protein
VPGATLDGIHSLRTLADSEAIRDAAPESERAVVVGGGFIGMEVAASLRTLGLDVTLIDVGAGLFRQLGSRQLSEELGGVYRLNGVELVLGDRVRAFEGQRDLTAVTTLGGRRIEADLAIVGIGVLPAVDFLAASGLPLANGVVVDDRYATAAPGVYAAGDVANFFDPLFNRRRRIEHWSNANYQGSQVGAVLAGQDRGYDSVSSFFTEVFGISLKVFGDLTHFDSHAAEGSLAEGDFVAFYGEGGRLVGALSVGQSETREARLKEAIAVRAPFAPAQHPEFALAAEAT